jgi:hypothetical protein
MAFPVEGTIQLSSTVLEVDNTDFWQDASEDTITIGGVTGYGFSSFHGWCTIAQIVLPWNPCSGTGTAPSTGGAALKRIY